MIARSERGDLTALLLLLGTGWGLSQPLGKMAVRDGYGAFGILFWQLTIGAMILAAINLARGGRWPLHPAALRVYAIIAFVGTLVPNSIGYTAAFHLPAGVMALAIATVPMFAFPISLALRTEGFRMDRLLGLILGLGGVALIILSQGGVSMTVPPLWVMAALVAPFLYAVEANYVARWGTAGLDPVEVLLGASVLGSLVMGPLALASGQFIDPRPPWGVADAAVLLLSCAHSLIYTGYVWLVGRAGSVFAAQVSYLVTGTGVLWSMLLLGERYSLWIWASLVLMMAGLALVTPRPAKTVA